MNKKILILLLCVASTHTILFGANNDFDQVSPEISSTTRKIDFFTRLHRGKPRPRSATPSFESSSPKGLSTRKSETPSPTIGSPNRLQKYPLRTSLSGRSKTPSPTTSPQRRSKKSSPPRLSPASSSEDGSPVTTELFDISPKRKNRAPSPITKTSPPVLQSTKEGLLPFLKRELARIEEDSSTEQRAVHVPVAHVKPVVAAIIEESQKQQEKINHIPLPSTGETRSFKKMYEKNKRTLPSINAIATPSRASLELPPVETIAETPSTPATATSIFDAISRPTPPSTPRNSNQRAFVGRRASRNIAAIIEEEPEDTPTSMFNTPSFTNSSAGFFTEGPIEDSDEDDDEDILAEWQMRMDELAKKQEIDRFRKTTLTKANPLWKTMPQSERPDHFDKVSIEIRKFDKEENPTTHFDQYKKPEKSILKKK